MEIPVLIWSPPARHAKFTGGCKGCLQNALTVCILYLPRIQCLEHSTTECRSLKPTNGFRPINLVIWKKLIILIVMENCHAWWAPSSDCTPRWLESSHDPWLLTVDWLLWCDMIRHAIEPRTVHEADKERETHPRDHQFRDGAQTIKDFNDETTFSSPPWRMKHIPVACSVMFIAVTFHDWVRYCWHRFSDGSNEQFSNHAWRNATSAHICTNAVGRQEPTRISKPINIERWCAVNTGLFLRRNHRNRYVIGMPRCFNSCFSLPTGDTLHSTRFRLHPFPIILVKYSSPQEWWFSNPSESASQKQMGHLDLKCQAWDLEWDI